MPGGITFNANTGALGGTPALGTGGSYSLTFTAANGVGNNAVQSFRLTITQAPVITSANTTKFTVGTVGSFTVRAGGFPAPTLHHTGPLPSGVAFDAISGVLRGTPAPGTVGTYPVAFSAANGILPDATQNFMLIVSPPAPTVTSFSPQRGTFGSEVTIAGTTFVGVQAVKFNGKAATFSVNSATQITATVPNGAYHRSVSVVTQAEPPPAAPTLP